MEPFDSQDPLTKLLARARKIEARSNFTQNVLREARRTPQDRGWLAALRGWWEEAPLLASHGKWSLASGVAIIAFVAVAVLQVQPGTTTPQVVHHVPAAPAVAPVVQAVSETSVAESGLPDMPAAETAWEASYQTEALLAVEDTSQFTDSEIGFLLY